MSVSITIPSPGESVSEVTIGTWHKSDGEWVEKDETIVEIESDKVTLEVPAPESGVLKVKAESGKEMAVGDTIGEIDPSAKPAKAKVAAAPKAQDEATAAKPRAAEEEQPTPQQNGAAKGDGQQRATPLARKMAADKSVDLASVQGTGPSGRITKADILAASTGGTGSPVSAGGTGETPVPTGPRQPGSRGTRREKMTKLRQKIAERLVSAQHNAAMLTTFNECDMTSVMALRSKHKEEFEKSFGVGLGFMSFFVKASVEALRKYPRVNASIVGNEIEYHDFNDISIAVGTDKGLVVPVLRSAETMTFAQIEMTIKDFATRAKAGKLSVDEMTGGTFTISNGGVYGSLNSTPILNPPQSAILGMHAIKKRAVEDPLNPGQIALRPMMYLAVSYDHRIIDGSEAVSFLVSIKNAIEQPERLMLSL
jgi:2-oxoglutarate dehydrogenase E2 component (dihydrolipoamide succinyltransferase)